MLHRRKNKSSFVLHLRRYLAMSNVHGLKHIVDPKLKTPMLVLWGFLLLASFALCFTLIVIQLNRFRETAVDTGVISTGYPVWKHPFPSVTICNNNVVFKNNTQKIVNLLTSRGIDEENINNFLTNLSYLVICNDCEETLRDSFDIQKIEQITTELERFGYHTDILMKELVEPCDSLLRRCRWLSKSRNCSEMFRLIKTTFGYCCAFNYFGTKDQQQDHFQDHVWYSSGAGPTFGLQVHINFKYTEYMSPFKFTPGVDIFVRNGLDFPQMTLYSNSLFSNQKLTIGLYGNVYRSKSEVRHLHYTDRKCWFEDEGHLKWTHYYNSLTCFNECKARQIRKVCSCLPYYYSFDGNDRMCTLIDVPCLLYNKSLYSNLALLDDFHDNEIYTSTNNKNQQLCHCLPSCDEVKYEVYIDKMSRNMPLENLSIVNIHYNSVSSTLIRRSVHITWDALLAAIGGIFGLCLGGSIISLLELLLYILNLFVKRNAGRVRGIKRTHPDNKIHIQKGFTNRKLHLNVSTIYVE